MNDDRRRIVDRCAALMKNGTSYGSYGAKHLVVDVDVDETRTQCGIRINYENSLPIEHASENMGFY